MTISEEWIKKTIEELEKDLAAAIRFFDFCQRNGLIKKPQNPNRTKWRSRGKMVEYGSVKLAIMRAIEACPDVYSIDDVEIKLLDGGSPLKKKSISRWLHYMHEMGEIERVYEGVGRAPSLYRRVKTAQSEPDPTNTASPTP